MAAKVQAPWDRTDSVADVTTARHHPKRLPPVKARLAAPPPRENGESPPLACRPTRPDGRGGQGGAGLGAQGRIQQIRWFRGLTARTDPPPFIWIIASGSIVNSRKGVARPSRTPATDACFNRPLCQYGENQCTV